MILAESSVEQSSITNASQSLYVCTRQINLKITEIVMFDIVHVS